MSEQQAFATHIVDLLAEFGPCAAKRMFGGHGIFHQDLMFGLIADGEFYLKADDETRDLFLDEGSEAFTYYKQDKPVQLSYYLAPDAFFEDPQATLHWARLAFDCALRASRRPVSGRNKKP